MLNRSIPPTSELIELNPLGKLDIMEFSNGLKMYSIMDESAELIKLELIINAGEKQNDLPLIPKAATQLLKNGTKSKSAAQIADEIDFYGAFVETSVNMDYASIQIYTLSKFLDNVLAEIIDLLENATYPEDEIQTYLENKKQGLMVNLQKVSFLAKRKFREVLYGTDHPYGKSLNLEDFSALNRTSLIEFYQTNFNISDSVLFVAGNVNSDIRQIIKERFEPIESKSTSTQRIIQINKQRESQEYFHVQHNNAVQSGIRMGRVMFPKSDADYIDFTVLNVLFGGYFGSRLMSNIREDKGYTYGISSGLVAFKDSGYFVIATEVGVDVTSQTIDEIKKEMQTLCTTSVKNDELDLVKNFILGSFLRNLDGAFAQIEWMSNAYQHNLDFDFYLKYIESIKVIDSQRLMELANNYLNIKEFKIVTSGKEEFSVLL